MYVAQCCNSKWCKVNGTSLGRMYYTRFGCLVQGPSIKYVGISFRLFDNPLPFVGTFLLISVGKFQGHFGPPPFPN